MAQQITAKLATNALSVLVADLKASKIDHVLIGIFPEQGGFRTVASLDGDNNTLAHGLGEKLLELLRNPKLQEATISAMAGALHRSPFKGYLHPDISKRYDALATLLPDSTKN